MEKQIRNIVNAYVLVMGLVLLLLLAITIRVVDIYYNDDMHSILENRVLQLESIFTNYTEAGEKLKKLNGDYIDTVLYTRLEGVLDLTRELAPSSPDITTEYSNLFGKLEGHQIHVVPTVMYTPFMTEKFELNIDYSPDKIEYYNSYIDGERWRIITKYVEVKNAVVVVAENIKDVDHIRLSFKEDIGSRIEEHLKREPMDVSIIMISRGEVIYCSDHDGDHSELELIDIRTGKPLKKLIHELEDSEFEYQLKTEEGYKQYYAVVRMSSEYDAHILLSMEKQSLKNRIGKYADTFLKFIWVLMIIICTWTVVRFRKLITTKTSAIKS